jgi:hypothetical protein
MTKSGHDMQMGKQSVILLKQSAFQNTVGTKSFAASEYSLLKGKRRRRWTGIAFFYPSISLVPHTAVRRGPTRAAQG